MKPIIPWKWAWACCIAGAIAGIGIGYVMDNVREKNCPNPHFIHKELRCR